MYAVILAGGGGTRLHPLSGPERPKPFLPLLGRHSLLQLTVARLMDGSELDLTPADVTVVTHRSYARLVEEQLPGIAVLAEPQARNTAAAVALATVAIDRPDDEVMAVLPADHAIDAAREGVFRSVLRSAADHLATGAFDIEDPLVTLGIRPDRPATEYGYLIPRFEHRARIGGLEAYPLRAFEEKPKVERAMEIQALPGAAWNAGMFLWRRRAIRAVLQRYTGLVQSLEPMFATPVLLDKAYDGIRPISIDHAVMEGAARDGRVVMAAMDVGWSDIGSWTALLDAIGAPGHGDIVRAGETVETDTGDLVVRRLEGRVGLVEVPERGTMTAVQTIAVLRGARDGATRIEDMLRRCSTPEAAS
ncbi:MAG TPA: sugar phosphate nucleotidyltransferase [Clostridia bacterium]|nr:sugar phosphate nucleotidyltransferase [Clostridia bacterium]